MMPIEAFGRYMMPKNTIYPSGCTPITKELFDTSRYFKDPTNPKRILRTKMTELKEYIKKTELNLTTKKNPQTTDLGQL